MRFRLGQLFAAPLAAVEQAYFDPGVLERLEAPSVFGKMELLEQRADGELITQRVRYHFRGQLSAAVTAVVDARRLSWVEETVYDCGAHRGAITVIPDHYADRLSCRASVALAEVAGATATRREREGELSVHVPFVAGRVERAIVSGLEEHAALEERIVQQWLDEQTARRG